MLQKITRMGLVVLLLLSTIISMPLPTVMAENDTKTIGSNHIEANPPKTCGQSVRTVNGSFEKPVLTNKYGFFHPDEVPGWDTIPFRSLRDYEFKTAFPATSDYFKKNYPNDKSGRLIEYQNNLLVTPPPPDGKQAAELNAVVGGVLYTKIPIPNPKQDIYLSVWHKQTRNVTVESMYIVVGKGTPQTRNINERGDVINTIYKSPQYIATPQWTERKAKISANQLPTSGEIYLGFFTPEVEWTNGNLLDNVHFGTPACLEYEKKAPKQVHVGETFNYTVTAKNVGGFPAKEINLKDVLPEQVVANGKPTAKIISATTKQTKSVDLQFISQNDYSQMKYNGEIDIDDQIEFTIPVKAVQAGEAKNQASLMYKDTAANVYAAWEQTNTVSTSVKWKQADVSIQKSVKSSDGTNEIFPGHLMEYTIEVKNHTSNSEIMNAIVEDLLPEGVELAGDIKVTKQPDKLEMTTSHTGKQLFYKIPKLQGNESISIQIPVKVLPSAMQKTVSNTAKLTYQQPDQQLVTKESKTDFKVLPLNPLVKLKKTVEKVGGGDTYNVGDRVKYIITAENTIPGSIAESVNLTVFDKLPEGITIDETSIQMSVPEGTYTFDQNARQLTFQLGRLTGGNAATMTFEGVLNEKSLEKVVINTVTAKVDLPNGGGEFEPDPSNPATIIIQSKEPKLVGEKSHQDVNGGEVKVGDTIQYTVRTKQEEVGASLKKVVIEDTLPEYLRYKEGSGKVIKVIDRNQQETQLPVHTENNKLVAELGDIRDGEYIFTFEVEVLRHGAGQTFINEAYVKGSKPIVEKDGNVKLGEGVNLLVKDQGELTIKPYDEPTKPVDPVDPKEPVEPIDPTTPDKKPIGGTKGPLSLDFASSLNFGEQVLSSKDEKYFAKSQELADGSQKMNYVQITDNRMKGSSWTLSVKQNGQLKDEKGRKLDGAKITFHNAEVVSSTQMPELSLAKDSFDITADSSGATQHVLVGKSGTEESTYIYRFGNEETKGSSIQLEVPGETIKYAVAYKTTLTWSLSDVPVNE
ncbi:WxL domain-containing protein [Bacillus cereus]|uniref:WxL domain-containing protein n=1 Tax=Bacillus cereus TaxID=1396 RepID=UPI003CECAF17